MPSDPARRFRPAGFRPGLTTDARGAIDAHATAAITADMPASNRQQRVGACDHACSETRHHQRSTCARQVPHIITGLRPKLDRSASPANRQRAGQLKPRYRPPIVALKDQPRREAQRVHWR